MDRIKLLRRTAGAIVALLVFAAVALLVVVHTDGFRRFVLREIEAKAESSLGARLTIENMAIDWRLLQLDFYGVTLHGRESDSQAPLFVADHLRVGLKIISLLRSRVDLREIVLDRPVAHIYVNSSGSSKLPQASSVAGQSGAPPQAAVNTILNAAIQHLEINSGRFFYNDDEVPLSVELVDLRAQVDFNRLVSEYRGTLAYSEGRIVVKDFKPIAHGLQMAFVMGRDGVRMDPITFMAGESIATAHAKLENYDDPRISGTYEASVSTSEVLRITNSKPVVAGLVALAGGFTYHSEVKKSWMESAALDGKMSARELRVVLGQKSISAESLRGEYQLQGGDLHLRNVVADALGGRLNANYDLLGVTGKSSSRLDGKVENASLEKMNDVAPAPTLKRVRLVGSVDGTVRAAWTSRVQDAIAKVHVVIRNSNGAVAQSGTIPLSGLIDVDYNGARQYASLGNSYLKTGNTTASVSGILSTQSRLNAELNTSDLRELTALVSMFEKKNTGSETLSWLSDLAGSARFQGQVLRSLSDPRIQGELFANNLQIQKTQWRSLHVSLDAASNGVRLRNGSASDTQKGQLTFNLDAGLQEWSFNSSKPISLQLSAKEIAVAEVQQLAQSSYPVSGIIAASISLHGSEENPQGQGSIQVSHASAWNEPLNNLSVNFTGDGNSIHSTAQVAAPAGNLSAEFTFAPKVRSYDIAVQSPGIKLENLHARQIQSLGVSGTATLSASGHGTFDNPQIIANLQIPKLQIRDWALSDIQAQLNSANHHADFVLNSKAEQTSIQARGDVTLNGEYPATASLDVHEIPVAVVLAKYLPPNQKFQGDADLQASLKGPLKNLSAMSAQVEIPKLNIAYQSANLALVRPLLLKYTNGLATLEEAQFQGTGTNLKLAGSIPIKSAQPLNLSAKGTVDLALLQGFAEDVHSSGHVDINLSARGELSRPAVQGEFHIVDARLATESVPVGLDGLNALVRLSGNRIEIANFSGSAGGGTVSAHGFMTYGQPSSFNVGLDLKSVRLRYPEGIRSILTGNLALNGSSSGSRLTGRVVVDRLSFTQQFDLANVLGQFSSTSSSAASSTLESNMKLNVSIATSPELSLTNSKVSVDGSANLTLIGTLADPVILGRTSLTTGEIFFMGKRYEIQSGTIEFANPNRTTPVLNLNVTTTVQQYNIRLNFVGPLDRLRTNYTSDPPLPSADIINLVAFGKTSEQAATSPSTPATLGAESVLAQGVSGKISGKIERLTGISQITIDPLATNNQTNPGSRVAIQQRVSGNLLLTFSTDVTSTQNESIQVQYQATKNLSISVLRDQYGGYAADVRLHKSF